MTNENDLMMKLVAAKQIMKKHDQIGRGGIPNNINEYTEPSKSTYNVPQEYMNESLTMGHLQTDNIDYPLLSESAMAQKNITKPYSPAPSERIMSSKLPDAIKQLMIEHPIHQPDSVANGSTISNELVEKSSRLMNSKANGEAINPKQRTNEQHSTQSFNGDLKSMIVEAVREVLSENGLITESTTKTNEVFTFKVGSHLFEGKLTKIKKLK